MPSLEVSNELDGEQEQDRDQEGLDETVEPRGGRVGGGSGGRDPTVGSAEERNDAVGEEREAGKDLLESQEAHPGQLACAACSALVNRPVGGGATDVDGEGSSGRILRGRF